MKVALAILSFLLAYSAWPYLWHGAFYQLMAIGILILMWDININCIPYTFKSAVSSIGLWLAFNNLLDEIIFNPKSIDANEYIVALVIVVTQINMYRNGRQSRRTIGYH